MIIEPDKRNVATAGVDDGKSKRLKAEGRNDEVDKLAKTEFLLTYKDEARTRFAVVDEGMEEDVGGSCMVKHVRPESRKMARNTNVAKLPIRIVDDDVDAVRTEILIRIIGVSKQGLLSDEDVRISQTRFMENRRGCDEELFRDFTRGNVMAFDDERGVAVDKEQKIGANNIVVVNKQDLPADATFVVDVDRGGIEIVTVQRVCDEGIKFDDECGKIFLRLLQRSSHGRKITWGNGAGV